jgi:hypothetical protein
MNKLILSLGLLLIAASAAGPSVAQFGNFFNITYQGELIDNGVPVNGDTDMTFLFYDSPQGGAPQSSARLSVPVVDGRFTVRLPVQPDFFEQPSWLEIQVNDAATGGSEVLSPRQPVTSAPRALIAEEVVPSALLWQPAGIARGQTFDIMYDRGFVGIGTPEPQAPLEVEDNEQGPIILARQSGDQNGDSAVLGEALATSGNVTGVWGRSLSSPNGTGVLGVALGGSGLTRGVHGISESPDGSAVHAQHIAGSGTGRALWASTDSSFGYAGFFEGGRNYFEGRIGIGEQTTPNYLLDARGPSATLRAQSIGDTPAFLRLERDGFGQSYIALGMNDSMFFNINATDRMVLSADGQLGLGTQSPGAAVDVVRGGSGDLGVRVTNSAGGVGFDATLGSGGVGFEATLGSGGVGFDAFLASGGIGVRSSVSSGTAVQAQTSTGWGVLASATAAGGVAIEGEATSTSGAGVGVRGTAASSQGVGVEGITTFDGVGVRGISLAGGIGVHASAPANGLAMQADGDVTVNGTLIKSAGSFRIDHPLDPRNRYLSHSFVESPDMMNIYNGNVVTDEAGFAEVEMPEWFDALNRDFRYQLTVIGSFARATVGEKLQDGRFVILTDEPNVEVSWQITGIRDDPYARANPIEVESDKPASQRGRYQFADYEHYESPASR